MERRLKHNPLKDFNTILILNGATLTWFLQTAEYN